MATGVRAQSIGPSTINAAGGGVTIGSSNFAWSAGEMTLVSTFTTPGIIVTQGVLQPSGNAALTVPVTGELSKAPHVFPNPARDYVNVQYTSSVTGTLSCKLLDVAGKEISREEIAVANGQAAGQIYIRSLAAATYMLEITIIPENGSPQIAAYKIQKLR